MSRFVTGVDCGNMKIFGLNIGKTANQNSHDKLPNVGTIDTVTAYTHHGSSVSNLSPVFYGGEKTPYMLGRPAEIINDYYSMRARTWEAFLKSDVVQNAIRKYCLWIVGSGLKLQSDIKEDILKKYDINLTDQQINELESDIQNQFRMFATLPQSTYSQEENLHEMAIEALKNAIIAGDVLCIVRYDGKQVSMEIIDGHYVQTPLLSDDWQKARERGHKIINGVEIDGKGSHIAYYVKQDDFSYKRIRANGAKTKRRQAWLMYGLKYKKTDTRGLSLFSAVLETFYKMDRYRGATLTAAEENAKVLMSVEHGSESDGENPFAQQVRQSLAKDKGTAPETEAQQYADAATKVAQTIEGRAMNMPKGATLKRHAGSTDENFADFFKANIEIVYATLGIPPEVAMDKYEQNYSSSRAALKSWEFKMMVDRKNKLHNQYYKPFFNFWMDIAVMDNRVNAEGYLQALTDNNYMVLEAYRSCRFIGAGVPHIDPLKEVNAERAKLGKQFDNYPLTDFDSAMENLNTGEFKNVVKKIKDAKDEMQKILGDVVTTTNNGGAANGSSNVSGKHTACRSE